MTKQISYFITDESRLIEFLISEKYTPVLFPLGEVPGRILEWSEVIQKPVNVPFLFSERVLNHCSGFSDLFQSLIDTFAWISWVRCRLKAEIIHSGIFQFEIKSGPMFSDIEKTLSDDYKRIKSWFTKNTETIREDPWRGWHADPSQAKLEEKGFILKI